MARAPTHPNRKEVDTALDIIEETLATLREKANHQCQLGHLSIEPDGRNINTNVDDQDPSLRMMQDSVSSKGKEQNTSVLIKRKPNKYRYVNKKKLIRTGSNNLKSKCDRDSYTRQSRHPLPKQFSNAISGHEHKNTLGSQKAANVCQSTSHSSKLRQGRRAKRGSFNLVNEISAISTTEEARCSSTSTQEILRQNTDTLSEENERNRAWVPPLSQSSPREEHIYRSKSKSSIISDIQSDFAILKRIHLDSLQSTKSPVLSSQNYTEPTISSKLRMTLYQQKKQDVKENMLPFIPSGSSNKSHHVGIIVQQKLGLLKQIPYKKLASLSDPPNPLKLKPMENDSDSPYPTEEAIKIALSNIKEHIGCIAKLP